MAGGPILPSSVYLGAASGNLFPSFYIPATNTSGAGAFEGIGVVSSLGTNGTAVMQFNMPESIPTGTLKCYIRAMANATSGTAKVTISDINTADGKSLGTASLNAESQISPVWTTADVLVGTKVTLTSSPVANDILSIVAAFNNSGWSLAAVSTWQFSVVWE